MIHYLTTTVIVLVAAFVDAYADGSRRRWSDEGRRAAHIALSCTGDAIVLGQVAILLGHWGFWPCLVFVAAWRYRQERWWNYAPVHLGVPNDRWHRQIKQPRLYVPILVSLVATAAQSWTWWALPWAAGLAGAGSLVWRAGKRLSRAPW